VTNTSLALSFLKIWYFGIAIILMTTQKLNKSFISKNKYEKVICNSISKALTISGAALERRTIKSKSLKVQPNSPT
jgi:hypothetical protein